MVQAGSFLTTPYAFPYDMPMLTNAVVTSIIERTRRGCLFSLPDLAILMATFVLPVGMLLWQPEIPFSATVLALFCLMLALQARRQSLRTITQ
jgi:hypothetical protein